MFSIDVELLTGRYAAASYNDRSRAEWPPHPARLFSALVAAHHAGAGGDAQEREALLWLERQPPPSIRCDVEAEERSVLDVYVPVNDVTVVGEIEKSLREAREALHATSTTGEKRQIDRAEKQVKKEEKKLADKLRAHEETRGTDSEIAKAAKLLPQGRTRQVRQFPVALPAEPIFSFIWSTDLPDGIAFALQRLCDRVTRLGHSSSLVRCTLSREEREATLVPDETAGGDALRVTGARQLERLEAEFARHQGIEPNRLMPFRPQAYRSVGASVPLPQVGQTVFSDEWIIFERVGGARFLASRGVDLARAMRRALLEQHGTETLPPSLSGHDGTGAAPNEPHVAFVPLPNCGFEYSDGALLGLAIVVPRSISRGDKEQLLRLIAGWERRSQEGVVEVAAESLPPVRLRRTEFPGKASLRPSTWCRPARHFVTVTPIALDRNPGNLRSNFERTAHKAAIEAQRSISESCRRIGLDVPVNVEISLAPLLTGVQPLRDFRSFPGTSGRTPRVRVHAEIEFADPVRGPLLLGAGRYYGLGLLRPMPEEPER